MRGRRTFVIASCVVAVLATGACGDESALGKATASLAKSQGVEEAAVTGALRRFAATEDEQLALARQWERDLPKSPLPNLTKKVETFSSFLADEATQALIDAGCAAVFDSLRTGRIPNAAAFEHQYLQAAVFQHLPGAQLHAIADEFERLYEEVVAGQLTYIDARLTIMKFQYCG
jgi:hypothetical protein